MTATTPKLPDDLPDGNPHYIQAVTELGEEQEVQARRQLGQIAASIDVLTQPPQPVRVPCQILAGHRKRGGQACAFG